MEIRGISTSEVANKTVEAILQYGSTVKRTTGPWAMNPRIEKQPMLELRNVTLVVGSPRSRWNTKVGEGMCQEFIDYYLGLNPGYVHLTRWSFYDKWRSIETGRYPYTYGERICNRTGSINQWNSCIRKLRKDLTTRHATVAIWRPEDLKGDFVPCALQWNFQINGKNELEMTCMMRSQDALHGLFLDLFAYTHFHELMANELGLQTGSYTHFESNVHIYGKDLGSLKTPVSRDPPSSLTSSPRKTAFVKCDPLVSREKTVLLNAVKSWYERKEIRKFVKWVRKMPTYWQSLLSFQVLDNPPTGKTSEANLRSWEELHEYLSPTMKWILGERHHPLRVMRASRN